jgi:HK97 family phage major capsid protein
MSTRAATAAHVRNLASRANAIMAQARAEHRKLTSAEVDQIEDHLAQCAVLKNQLDQHSSVTNQIQAVTGLGLPASSGKMAGHLAGLASGAPDQPGVSPGAMFVASDTYRHAMANGGASHWANTPLTTARVQLGGLRSIRNALVTGSSEELLGGATTSAGLLVAPDHQGLIPPTYAQPLRLVDLLTVEPTDGDTVQYVRVSSVTNAAAEVPEATTAGAPPEPDPNNTAGQKPESEMIFASEETNVRTIAHTLPVTKKALSDVRGIQSTIDVFMRYGVEERLDGQILNGDGVGENLEGIATAAGTQTEAGVSGDTIVDKALRAKVKSKLSRGGEPTAYVMHPLDWLKFELAKDANEAYFRAGAFSKEDPKTLWRLPVVESESQPAGTGWVANWRQGVVFDREQSTISASDAHADFFVRNLIMVLAELRAGFALLHPSSFVDFTVAAVA